MNCIKNKTKNSQQIQSFEETNYSGLKFKLGRFPAGLLGRNLLRPGESIIQMSGQEKTQRYFTNYAFPLGNDTAWFLNDLLTHSFIKQLLINNTAGNRARSWQ